jgi:hypothetical protein
MNNEITRSNNGTNNNYSRGDYDTNYSSEHRGSNRRERDNSDDFIHSAIIAVGACASILTIVVKAIADSKRN